MYFIDDDSDEKTADTVCTCSVDGVVVDVKIRERLHIRDYHFI